jgi:hypothetical protein
MTVRDSEKTCVINGHPVKTGEPISIDGRSGAIYSGMLEVEQIDLSASTDYE